MQRDAGSRKIVSGKEHMTADADVVIISGAERSHVSLATLARSLGSKSCRSLPRCTNAPNYEQEH